MTATKEKEEDLIEIRASSLATHATCERMWAGKLAQDTRSGFAAVFSAHGFTVPTKRPHNIGSAIGSSLDEGFRNMWQGKLDGYVVDPEQVAVSAFRKLDDGTILFDQKVGTKDSDTAIKQIKRMVAEYKPKAETMTPQRMQFRMVGRPDPLKPYIISGTPDQYLINRDYVDLKAGKNLGQYKTQLGTYSLLGRSNGMDSNRLFIHWIPRSTINKPQKKLVEQEYDKRVAETAAHYEIEAALEQLEKFRETGNPWVFPTKPDQNLCTKKWCPVYGTPFCEMGKPEISTEESDE